MMIRRMLLFMLVCSMLVLASCENSKNGSVNEDGAIDFKLENYIIEEQGLCELVEILRKHVEMPQILTVAYFGAILSKKGVLENFTLSLDSYDDTNGYFGMYQFTYQHGQNKISIKEPATDLSPQFVHSYNANNELVFLDSQLKRLPLIQQIALLDFPRYVLLYNGTTKLSSEEPIIDGTNSRDFPVLTIDEYYRGEGGVSDGHTAVIFILYDGVSVIGEQCIHYRCDPADLETLYGNRDFVMEYDYYINRNQLFFTRDFGETWIQADISEEDMKDTLAFYRNGVIIPEDSYFITSRSNTIAFFYGSFPVLRISHDNGITWEDRCFDKELFSYLSVTKRVVHFFNENDGYIGLGTDWSMGSGEAKYCMITHDGGITWEVKNLPLPGSSRTLTGLCFSESDMAEGVVSLKSVFDDSGYPTLFYTRDSGETWTELSFPWEHLPDDVSYLNKVDSLSFEDGVYTLVLQAGNKKVSFESGSLSGKWSFVSFWQAVTHTVG